MYRLYLDEHGTHHLKRLHLDGHRYFSITGIAMKVAHARDYLVPEMNRLKAEIFDDDPDNPVILHRSDIRHKKGPFGILRDPDIESRFNELLLRIMHEAEYRVISVVLDKHEMLQKTHWENTHPYHFLMEVMVEKYTKFLIRRDEIGDIMPEARQGPPDKALQKEFEDYRQRGTRFEIAENITQRIRSKTLKFRTKSDNVAGLQLCDLLAHPSHYVIRHNMKHQVEIRGFSARVAKLLVDEKFDKSAWGNPWGYGAKYLP